MVMNREILTLLFVVCVFVGCNSHKNEDSIIYICLHTNLLYDSVENPYLHIKQYAEYKFSNEDSLFIALSEYNNNSSYLIDNEKPFHFGLEKFYANRIDSGFSELMTKILNGEYKESYIKEFGEGIDDRPIEVFVINRNGKRKFIFYSERYLLPEELKKADSLIAGQINLSTHEIDKPNYSLQIILNAYPYTYLYSFL